MTAEILEAFDRVGFSPRPGQVDVIGEIVDAFETNDFVVLLAPTGSGKSIIGAVTADALAARRRLRVNASVILMHNNVLVNQYHAAFSKNPLFAQIKGAAQYPCAALKRLGGVDFTAEDCVLGSIEKLGHDRSACERCEYRVTRERRNSVKHLITNFSYFFVDQMYAGVLEPRYVTVWDEAHTINEMFVEHNAIYLSPARITRMMTEISDHLKLGDPSIFAELKRVSRALENRQISEKNYVPTLKVMLGIYERAAERSEELMNSHAEDYVAYTRHKRFNKKYTGLGCKIDDLLKYNYEHIVQVSDDGELSVKPIFIKDMFQRAVCGSPKNLFMSATITDWFIKDTLNLSNVRFIKLPPTFEPSNKKLIFFNQQPLSYRTLADPAVEIRLLAAVRRVCEKHAALGEKGIILAPSFALCDKIAKTCSGIAGLTTFEHRPGDALSAILGEFKEFDAGSAVLISPSLYEGIDLPEDHCRFQVLVKAPFASLGDRRMKHILDNYPRIYELMTLLKIVQGAGRGVRTATDWCVTYALDANIARLWRSPDNVWKDEFETSFRTII